MNKIKIYSNIISPLSKVANFIDIILYFQVIKNMHTHKITVTVTGEQDMTQTSSNNYKMHLVPFDTLSDTLMSTVPVLIYISITSYNMEHQGNIIIYVASSTEQPGHLEIITSHAEF